MKSVLVVKRFQIVPITTQLRSPRMTHRHLHPTPSTATAAAASPALHIHFESDRDGETIHRIHPTSTTFTGAVATERQSSLSTATITTATLPPPP